MFKKPSFLNQATTWLDQFMNYNQARRMELELLKETNKLIENATNMEPLQKWVGKKYWYVRPNGIVEECTVAAVHLSIRNKKVDITVEGERGEYYNNSSFMSEADAKDLAKRVAGTYVEQILEDKKVLESEIERLNQALEYAIIPTKEEIKKAEEYEKTIKPEEKKKRVYKKRKNKDAESK